MDKFNTISKITLNDLINFGDEFLQQLKIIILIEGNITKENAILICEKIKENIQCSPILDVIHLKKN